MNPNQKNVSWQAGPDGPWSIGFWELDCRKSTAEHRDDTFTWVSTGYATPNEAMDAYPTREPSPSGGAILPWNEVNAEHISYLEKLAQKFIAERGDSGRRRHNAADNESSPIEGTVVEHHGNSKGSRPKDAAHPDVRAALAALTGLPHAHLTDGHDDRDYERSPDSAIRGVMVEPRGGGRVAAYWLENGAHRMSDGEPYRDRLAEIRHAFRAAGWGVERHSLWCVFAWRPSGTAEVERLQLAS
jgi:hypothetical protein